MKKLQLMTLCLLLSACASTGTRDGLVYRNGSWYSPAGEGHGDYYTGTSREPDAWDHPWMFGIGLVPYAGYCPVRYRYCTSFWADAYYNPYWYQPWVFHRTPHLHPHRRRGPSEPEQTTEESGSEVSPRRELVDRAPTRGPRQERPLRRAPERDTESRPRRRATASGSSPE